MSVTERLAERIASAPPSLVLPVRPRGAAVEVPGPLHLLGVLPLTENTCVALVGDSAGGRWVVPLIAEGPDIRRAEAGDGVASDLISFLMQPGRTVGSFSKVRWAGHRVSGERAITVDQTNDSIIVGEAAVVKWTVRAPAVGEPGSPAGSRITTLAYRHFEAMPEPWGLLEWNDGEQDLTIATVAAYLPETEDGWDWAVRDVGEYATGITYELPIDAARQLGSMTATMHAALSQVGVDRATAEVALSWRNKALVDLDEALHTIDGPELDRLKARAPRIRVVLDRLSDAANTPLIDIHGDFHIGQVLRFDEPYEYVVTDFDGSPVLSPRERVAKQPAAVDVISMLASLDHVGRVVIKRVDGADSSLVRTWIAASQEAFLTAYRDSLGASQYDELVDETLFEPLRLHQELREYVYAAKHLPHWSYVADMALSELLPDEE